MAENKHKENCGDLKWSNMRKAMWLKYDNDNTNPEQHNAEYLSNRKYALCVSMLGQLLNSKNDSSTGVYFCIPLQ